jgi:predicted nucleotidyltransferase
MQLIPDLREFIELLNSEKVQYVIIGGWAVNFHAVPRATGDIDFFVNNHPENERKIRAVLTKFGFGSTLSSEKTSLFENKKILMLGRQPNRIDLITEIDGVTFGQVWDHKVSGILDGIAVHFINREHLLINKKAAARPKDLADVEELISLSDK